MVDQVSQPENMAVKQLTFICIFIQDILPKGL